jgi:hypothetical protein
MYLSTSPPWRIDQFPDFVIVDHQGQQQLLDLSLERQMLITQVVFALHVFQFDPEKQASAVGHFAVVLEGADCQGECPKNNARNLEAGHRV